MTEYEIANLLNEYQMSISVYGSTAFTTVTAFLVSGYLAAHRLKHFMLGTVIVVYTVWLSGAVGNIFRTLGNIEGLAEKARRIVEAGGGLEWHNVSAPRPEWIAPTLQASVVILMTAIYVASLVFFFYCRRVNRKAELAAEAPTT